MWHTRWRVRRPSQRYPVLRSELDDSLHWSLARHESSGRSRRATTARTTRTNFVHADRKRSRFPRFVEVDGDLHRPRFLRSGREDGRRSPSTYRIGLRSSCSSSSKPKAAAQVLSRSPDVLEKTLIAPCVGGGEEKQDQNGAFPDDDMFIGDGDATSLKKLCGENRTQTHLHTRTSTHFLLRVAGKIQ